MPAHNVRFDNAAPNGMTASSRDARLPATGLAGSPAGGLEGKTPMATERPGLLRASIGWVFATLPMTIWLTLWLATSAWTRPINETARVEAIYLPLFLLLDLIRHCASPRRRPYLAWLGSALAAARAGPADQPSPRQRRRLAICYGPLGILVAYIGAFIFLPAARGPGEAIGQVPAITWVYRMVGDWYPPAVVEPAHITRLGYLQDANDLRHFIAIALIFSLATVFVTAGPGRRHAAERWLVNPIRTTVQRGGQVSSDRRLFRIAIGQILAGGAVLAMFAVAGIESDNPIVYWQLKAFPPCVMFTLSGWLLSWGIAAVGTVRDMASVAHVSSMRGSSS